MKYVSVWRRAPWVDEKLRSFDAPALGVYEPETTNQMGRVGAYRDVVTPDRRDAAIAAAVEWASGRPNMELGTAQ